MYIDIYLYIFVGGSKFLQKAVYIDIYIINYTYYREISLLNDHVTTFHPGNRAEISHMNRRLPRPASDVPRRRCESENQQGARGLMGRERIAKRRLPLSLQQSHNSTGTANNDPTTQIAPRSKRGATPGDEAEETTKFFLVTGLI